MRSTGPIAFVTALLAGCGGGTGGPIAAPSYDAAAMAQAAISQYDKNGNGVIDGTELDAVPALKFSLAVIDTDKAVSADELKARFEAYKASGVGAVGVSCTVKMNGQPLTKAVVTFVPEECMKDSVKGGTGTTRDDGSTPIATGGMPGMPCGLYKITVSKIEAGGSEQIPARYNAKSILGREVFADPRGGSPNFELNLTSP